MSEIAHEFNSGKAGRVVDGAVYDDLLNRFERLLAFSETLQTRLRHENRRSARLQRQARHNSRLQARIGLDEVYIALLEQSLDSLGALQPVADDGRTREGWPTALGSNGANQPRGLHLAGRPAAQAAR